MIRFLCIVMGLSGAVQAQTAPDVYSTEVIARAGNSASLLYINVLDSNLQNGAYDTAAEYMDALCREYGLQEAANQTSQGIGINEITTRLTNQPMAYGETNPEVVQFMSFYDISTGECAWH